MRKLIVAASVIALAVAGQAFAAGSTHSSALQAGDRLGSAESDDLTEGATAAAVALGGLALIGIVVAVTDDNNNDDGVSG